MSGWFWRTYQGHRLCALLGHARLGTLTEKGNEHCDCGADHTYRGCIRCRASVDRFALEFLTNALKNFGKEGK